ncbi:hypothetical protein [Arenimonas alkanexedens]
MILPNIVFRSLLALVLGSAVLCLLVQPVLSAGHELHELEHVQVASAADGCADDTESVPEPGTLEGLLHAFDCCLHATALTGTALAWTPRVMGASPPKTAVSTVAASPLSRFLRPPISA